VGGLSAKDADSSYKHNLNSRNLFGKLPIAFAGSLPLMFDNGTFPQSAGAISHNETSWEHGRQRDSDHSPSGRRLTRRELYDTVVGASVLR
jgi:hypothetical protein